MQYELSLLRAIMRLTRRQLEPSTEGMLLRTGGSKERLERALGRLERAGFVQRSARGPRLTMAGLAIAVASAPVAPGRVSARSGQVRPLDKRRAA